jgi:hypothetical protein
VPIFACDGVPYFVLPLLVACCFLVCVLASNGNQLANKLACRAAL